MRISYSILWFDDTADFFESLDLEPLIADIKSWGFDPKIRLVTKPKEFMSFEPFKEFDLIVVDYNLEEYDLHGEEFIKQIRNHDVYTEVVFYSANPASELWNAVREKELEGVFISNRTTVVTKIQKVSAQSVRKILDLENVRGIVMAEVGNIDLKLESIINAAIVQLSKIEQDKIFNNYKQRIGEQAQSRIDTISSIEENCIDGLLSHCDSSKKWNIFQSIAKKHPDINLTEIGDYSISVLVPRNFLAHGTPEKQNDGSLLFKHHGREFVFDESVSATLRNDLQKYFEIFEKIFETLN